MKELNRVILLGTRGDAELTANTTKEGKKWCWFNLAQKYTYPDGKPATRYFEVTTFGETAELMLDRTKKGTVLLIDGYLQSNVYIAKNGEKRKTINVVATNIQLIAKSVRNKDALEELGVETEEEFQEVVEDDPNYVLPF